MAVETTLQPVREKGWRMGMANLLHKELHLWWSTRRWLRHALIWSGLLGGLLVLVSLVISRLPAEAANLPEVQAQLFFGLGGLATAIGVIITVQDAIIGERQAGTVEWILAKPVARAAFVLSKLIAHGLGFGVTAIALPAALALLLMGLWQGVWPPLGRFALATGLLALHLAFYLALTLMLGTLCRTRAAVSGSALAVLGSGMLLPTFVPQIVLVFPFKLPDLGAALVLGENLPPALYTPIAAGALWTVLFVALALWRFEREEI